MSYLEGFAQQIATDGFGVYSASAVYTDTQTGICVENMPTQPDRVIGVFAYAGPESDIKLPYDEPSLQLRVRGTEDPLISRDLAEQLYGFYHGKRYFTLATGEYVVGMIGVQSGPVPIGRDENGRHEHTINFRLMIRMPTVRRV